MSFLTAEWRKLALVNYAVPQAVLQPYVPTGTELDLWQGNCYVSLVGFRFVNTRLLGLPIPWHTHFEEVNLRFYVKRHEGSELRRGVVFIKEIVPKPAITWVANTLYKEHYATNKMRHNWEHKPNSLAVSYGWKAKGSWQSLLLEAEPNAVEIEPRSEAEFITEHYWGYTQVSPTVTFAYEVRHPRWQVYPVLNCAVKVDFEACYGKAFAFLNQTKPASTMLAEGSKITVESKQRLRPR